MAGGRSRGAADDQEIIDAILSFDEEKEKWLESIWSFSEHTEANRFVFENEFAFLLGVIANYQVKAERAWELPYRLRERLGHLDPSRIHKEPGEAMDAVAYDPPLHRFKNRVGSFVASAAKQVVEVYGGDAEAVWSDEPTVAELQQRLTNFEGMGQKKAAMAVEILARDLGVELGDMRDSDLAHDVHTRRVFLRTGLAEEDERGHIIEAARRKHPQRPGEIDNAVWRIGRNWCHANDPDCSECPLSESCPQLIGKSASVDEC